MVNLYFSGFMEDLNWGTLNADQADELSYGLEKLAQKLHLLNLK